MMGVGIILGAWLYARDGKRGVTSGVIGWLALEAVKLFFGVQLGEAAFAAGVWTRCVVSGACE